LLSTELQLAIAPARTYGRLVDNGEGGRAGALAPIAFSALATGLTVAFLASRWASVELVATTASSWGFTLALQLVGACAVILPGQRRVGLPRAFELFFLGHAPWTLWMLAVGALAIAGRGAFGAITAVILSGLLPWVPRAETTKARPMRRGSPLAMSRSSISTACTSNWSGSRPNAGGTT
jgi:hypothetical protein